MFDYPLRRQNVHARLKNTEFQLRQERRKPNLPGPYIYVGDFDALDPPGATWQSPPWQNNWTYDGTNYVAFRHGLDGDVEFIGALDPTAATSGTVAFTLPIPWRPSTPFSFLTDMDLGATFDLARIAVAINGQVKVYFPFAP